MLVVWNSYLHSSDVVLSNFIAKIKLFPHNHLLHSLSHILCSRRQEQEIPSMRYIQHEVHHISDVMLPHVRGLRNTKNSFQVSKKISPNFGEIFYRISAICLINSRVLRCIWTIAFGSRVSSQTNTSSTFGSSAHGMRATQRIFSISLGPFFRMISSSLCLPTACTSPKVPSGNFALYAGRDPI